MVETGMLDIVVEELDDAVVSPVDVVIVIVGGWMLPGLITYIDIACD